MNRHKLKMSGHTDNLKQVGFVIFSSLEAQVLPFSSTTILPDSILLPPSFFKLARRAEEAGIIITLFS